jgi:hypothetical protein
MRGALQEVDHSLSEVIRILESEESSEGGSQEGNVLLEKFRGWINELYALRGGVGPPLRSPGGVWGSPERVGGLFAD